MGAIIDASTTTTGYRPIRFEKSSARDDLIGPGAPDRIAGKSAGGSSGDRGRARWSAALPEPSDRLIDDGD